MYAFPDEGALAAIQVDDGFREGVCQLQIAAGDGQVQVIHPSQLWRAGVEAKLKTRLFVVEQHGGAAGHAELTRHNSGGHPNGPQTILEVFDEVFHAIQ